VRKRKIIEVKTKTENFQWLKYFHAIACCGYLTSSQNVVIYTTHIKKLIASLYLFVLRSKITEKQ